MYCICVFVFRILNKICICVFFFFSKSRPTSWERLHRTLRLCWTVRRKGFVLEKKMNWCTYMLRTYPESSGRLANVRQHGNELAGDLLLLFTVSSFFFLGRLQVSIMDGGTWIEPVGGHRGLLLLLKPSSRRVTENRSPGPGVR